MNQDRLKEAIEEIYGRDAAEAQMMRYAHLTARFTEEFGACEPRFFRAPGRTEIGGNHTDHQHGQVLAAAIDLDIAAAAAPAEDGKIRIASEGFGRMEIDLNRPYTNEDKTAEKGTAVALVRGMAEEMNQRGYRIGGFCAYAAGNVPEKILLTASGGPFRKWDRERIDRATRAEALKHPNWNMGAKITVDSASMFNKGLEIMEARWLFDMPEDKIEVVVHPQSIVHSAVVYQDGAVLAQLGEPDMRVPIGYAMAYPERIETGVPAPDLFKLGSLTFEKPDEDKFPALRLARECLRAGGAACTVFNGANEEAVAAFLREEIPFGEIAVRVERALEKLAGLPANCIEDIWEADRLARAVSNSEFRIQNSEL